jgi:hypothetical protein
VRDHREESILRTVGTLGEPARVALSREGLLALLLELLSLRDVAGNLRSANDTSSAVLDWGHRERDSYPTAVFPDALRLEVVDPFSPNERCENCRFLLKPDRLEEAS